MRSNNGVFMKGRVRFFIQLHFALCILFFPEFVFAQPKKDLVLWYNRPAKDWNEALPIGNGRLGAMVFGRVEEELIQLNEETLWTGGPVDLNPNPDAPKYLAPVREALFKDSIGDAVGLLKKMQGPDTEMYQPLGDLIIRQRLDGAPTNYYRDLDISNATATTKFTANGVVYSREIFSSAADGVIVLRFRANRKGTLNFSVGNYHPLRFERLINASKELVLKGKARITNDERSKPKPIVFTDSIQCDGMRFQWNVKVLNHDGSFTTDSMLHFKGATNVVLLISGATSYNGYEKCPDKDGKDEGAEVQRYLTASAKKTFDQLKAAHILDYAKFFKRVSFDIADKPAPHLPVDERLKNYKSGIADPALEALYFQFGRYLLISCSRPGGIPANLQGIWNPSLQPPWRSNYTTNINVQMNYWPAEMCNLSEMTEPLIQQIKRWAKNGAATAKNYYNM
ncbi:MAG TPA: glycoside hydrolase family 95 protein, partial [Chitinophagaceae bacterium]|nr:glycoside hydrolase family 95 protein [Chitinophagaceae bacterium]